MCKISPACENMATERRLDQTSKQCCAEKPLTPEAASCQSGGGAAARAL